VNLDPAQRAAVASQLGAVGNLLSIAANVHRFAQAGANPAEVDASGQTSRSKQKSPRDASADDDIIEAEFEEVKK
jgi:hypothetical protein